MKLTAFEKSWLRLLGTLALVILAVFLVQPFLSGLNHSPEPLADIHVLQLLAMGQSVPTPPDEPKGEFHGLSVVPPTLASLSVTSPVLGVSSGDDNKRIEVDLTNQKVYAFEGNNKVYEFTVSTGKWYPTPTGEFRIWAKVRSTKMEGGNKAWGTYYYLPRVPFVSFFYNSEIAKMRGFSFHGTYWHNNFGHPMSHGCVNMRIEDAQTLYNWAGPTVLNPKAWSTLASADNLGTRVVIYGVTPRE